MNTSNNEHIGVYSLKLIRNGKVIDAWESPNTAVDQGLAYMQTTAFQRPPTLVTPKAAWYVGIYSKSIADTNTLKTTTAATVRLDTTEIETYNADDGNRVPWNLTDASGSNDSDRVLTNAGNPATFTFTANATINGVVLCSSQANGVDGVATDVLFSITNFAASRSALIGDVLEVTYESTLSAV
jgi:hypothetical protein